MKIGIIGTRGIPNHYGGFEQFAEFLSLGLIQRGHEVSVYNSSNHPYQEKEWNGVKIIHCKDSENKIGTAGQFLYDRNCIRDSRARNFDVILQLGYTSSSIWGRFLPKKKSVITTNMDGLEWKRSKYSKPVRRFLKYAEKLGVKHSHHLIADSIGIQDYLNSKYARPSVFIPYGATIFKSPDLNILEKYNVEPDKFSMLIARLEPENNIDVILEGVSKSTNEHPFLVVGNHETKFGNYLKNKYAKNSKIKFLGGIYSLEDLDNLRYYSTLYFHGHSVGGTNPSLLEAMSSSALIVAHHNIFNASVLEQNAFYFSDANDVTRIINETNHEQYTHFIQGNLDRIQQTYSWDSIVDQYEDHFKQILSERSSPQG